MNLIQELCVKNWFFDKWCWAISVYTDSKQNDTSEEDEWKQQNQTIQNICVHSKLNLNESFFQAQQK